MACAGFQPSNVRDELLINPCRDIGRKDENTKLIESTSGIVAKLNSDRGDLLIRGFWDKSTDYIIDVRICDVNQPSYLTRKPVSIIKSPENSKKTQYLEPCLAQRRHFTSCVVSCEGMHWKEDDVLLKILSKKLADKGYQPYSQTLSFVKTRFAISIVRAKKKCFRGSRIMTSKISHHVDWEDGGGLGFSSTLE